MVVPVSDVAVVAACLRAVSCAWPDGAGNAATVLVHLYYHNHLNSLYSRLRSGSTLDAYR